MSIFAKSFSKQTATLALSAMLVACGGSDSTDETDGMGTGGGGFDIIETSLTGDSGTATNPCRSGRGTDADSSNDDWSDNCWIERDVDGAVDDQVNQDFADSSYSRAIQRIVWCDDLVDGTILADYDDGSFGPNTEMAVMDYQLIHGLTDDGIVGTATWAEMQDYSINYVETRVNDLDLIDIDVYAISSILPACEGLDAFYLQVDQTTGENGGWSMAEEIDEAAVEAEVTFSNGF